MQVYDVVVTYRRGQTALGSGQIGYEVVVLDANINEQALSGPAWGTWELWSRATRVAGTYRVLRERRRDGALRRAGRGLERRPAHPG